MIKKIAVLAATGLIGFAAFGVNDAEAQRRGGWSGGGFRGGGWGGPRVVYRGGYGWRGGYGYRGGYWRGGAVAAGLATGVVLGAAATYPYYGYGAAYPAYGYGYGAAYPAYGYGYGSADPYAASHEIQGGCRTVYDRGTGARVPVDCGW